jgi:APA family basic amino acid/polyamine antiporter
VTPPSARPLLKILGVSFGLSVAIGNTIGAGILRTPGDVAAALPNPWLFIGVWVVGACYALLGVNALAELGTMLPKAGAQYVFARHTFGDYAGFVVGWNDWISTAASAAAISIVFAESLASFGGVLAGHSVAIAIATVVVFTALLWQGSRLGSRAQAVTSLFKTLALMGLVVVCFARASGMPHQLMGPVAQVGAAAPSLFAGFVIAAQAVIYTYDGWSGPIYFSEELRDPARQIPRAMYAGLLCIAAIYLLVNVAFLAVLPVGAMAGSPLAAGTVAKALFGARGDLVVRAVVVISLPSAVNACLLMASRVLFAVSRDGLGPRITTRVNEGGTPTLSLLATSLVAIAFIATGKFQNVIAVAAFFFVANYALSFLALFVLRRREPDAARPYRARAHPWSTAIVLIGSFAFLVSAVASDRQNSAVALLLLVLTYPVFMLVRRSRATAVAQES